ncbi:MAG: hypothetical protein JNK12_02300 [Acidimicrobiales bacterium]|nr:hypothetical protein [Acidimicrobiales bacterium]
MTALSLAGALSACSTGDPVGDGAAADTVAPRSSTGPAPSAPGAATAPPVTLAAGDPEGARLRITQDLTDCCYPAGHLSWLLVLDPDGAAVVQRQLRPPADPSPVVDVTLPEGPYHVVSAQQACAATCASVGDAVDRCDAEVDLAPGSTNYLTIGVDPGAGCAIVLAATPLGAPVADEVALPAAEVDCGFDASLAEAAATGRNVVLSEARRCLAAAARRGVSAWLQADEPGDGALVPATVVYRLAADGSVDVYQVVDPTAPVWAWIRSSCAGTAPDEVRGFLVQGCAAAEAVPWVATT